MRKTIFLIFFVLLSAFASFATVVTVQNTTIPNYQKPGTKAYLRFFANNRFTTTSSQTIYPSTSTSGVWYKEVVCTVSAKTVNCPNFPIDTTTDSSLQTASYKVVLFDSAKLPVQVVSDKLYIAPDWGDTVSWTQIEMYNQSVLVSLPVTYYTATQVNVLIADLITADELDTATSVLSSGQTTQVNTLITTATNSLSSGQTTQVNNLITTAASGLATATDARFERELTKDYGSLFATANSSIGSVTQTTLNVNAPVTVNSTVAVNSNICVKFGDDGAITVASGVTLTINCLIDPGNRKVFTSTASGASVRLGDGIEKINISWWSGTTNGTDATDAINEAIASSIANGSGRIYFPSARYTSTGGHVLSDVTSVEGDGNFALAGFGGTSIQLVSPTTDYLFKVGEGEYGVRFRDILLDGTGTTNKYGILYEGTEPNTSADLDIERVTVQSFSKGLYQNALGGTTWQVAQIGIRQSIFQYNQIAVHTTSLNSQLNMTGVNVQIPGTANARAIQADGIGATTIVNSEFAGAAGAYTSDAAVIEITAAHVQINFIGCQDENIEFFMINNASDISGIVKLDGNLIQSKIQINQSMTLISTGNNYVPDTIRVAPGVVPRIYSTGDHVRTDAGTYEIPGVAPAVPLRLQNSNNPVIQTENSVGTGAFTTRWYQQILAPEYMQGDPTRPNLILGHGTTIGESKRLLRLCRFDPTNQQCQFWYDLYRQNSGDDAGRFKIEGNQTGFVGMDINGDIFANGSIRGQACNSTTGTAAIGFDPRCGNHHYATLNQNTTVSMTAMSTYEKTRADGQKITVELIQDATGSRTCTLSTGSAGQFAFGTDITGVTCTTTANKRDILTIQYSARADRWLVVDFKKGYE